MRMEIYDMAWLFRDKMGEMQKVMHAESQAKRNEVTDETTWAIVDSTWLSQWLRFVHSDEEFPSPGPVHNHRLIYANDEGTWKPRIGLVMEKTGHVGDYRKIHLETWRVFQELYPGSAPTITATFQETFEQGQVDPHAEDGHYPTKHWVITGAKKQRKSVFNIFEKFGIGHSVNDVSEDVEEETQELNDNRSNMKRSRSVEVARKKRDSLRLLEQASVENKAVDSPTSDAEAATQSTEYNPPPQATPAQRN